MSRVTIPATAEPALGKVTQGALEQTNRPLDLAIQGNGFFVVQTSTRGHVGLAYTRNGVFYLNAKNEMVLGLGDGYRLSPPITMPRGTSEIWIGQDGSVSCLLPGSVERRHVGQIRLARFRNPAALTHDAEPGLLCANDCSGPPMFSNPGQRGTGDVEQGFLEAP
jgi:flagellar basal-body rod protein FlgG